MIVIESIRLRNFRAVREAFFQPIEKGITGLFGLNGSGKTTFLAGTLFALFGTRPPGATVASLRREGSGKDECSVSVVFKHLGQTVEIIRELKSGNNRVVVDIYVDGMPQTVTSVGAADTWISQRLGVDSTGFLTAFIVRQKELDALITATPAVRKAIIEKLAGIDTINEALKNARKDENQAKAVLQSLPGSENAINEAESQVQLLSIKVDELRVAKEDRSSELQQAQETLNSLNTKIESLRAREAEITKIRSEIAVAETNSQNIEETLQRLAYVAKVEVDEDINALRDSHKELTNSANTLSQKIASGTVDKRRLDLAEKELVENINLVKEYLSQNVELENASLIHLETKQSDKKETIVANNQKRAVLNNKIEDYNEKINRLNLGDHQCPTCNTHLDDINSIVDSFKMHIDELISESDVLKQQNVILNEEILNTETLIRDTKEFIDKTASLKVYETELSGIAASRSSIPDVDKLGEELSQIEQQKNEITEKGLKIKQINEDRASYTHALSNQKVILQRITELHISLNEQSKDFSEQAYNSARDQLGTLSRKVQQLSSQLNDSFSEYSTFESQLAVANNHLRSAVEQWNRKKELLSAQERKALTTELIDKFRRESVAALAPELSEYATELISDITNGAYTEIRLDDDFNVTVVNSIGQERPVSVLSGGEESAVAFALRLAIAFLITGGNPALLWLDEVLTAQDADRRASMLDTIRKLPIEQIIMMNHAGDAVDVVDKSVTVIPNLTQGSTIVDGDGAGYEENKLDDLDSVIDSLDEIEDDIPF